MININNDQNRYETGNLKRPNQETSSKLLPEKFSIKAAASEVFTQSFSYETSSLKQRTVKAIDNFNEFYISNPKKERLALIALTKKAIEVISKTEKEESINEIVKTTEEKITAILDEYLYSIALPPKFLAEDERWDVDSDESEDEIDPNMQDLVKLELTKDSEDMPFIHLKKLDIFKYFESSEKFQGFSSLIDVVEENVGENITSFAHGEKSDIDFEDSEESSKETKFKESLEELAYYALVGDWVKKVKKIDDKTKAEVQ